MMEITVLKPGSTRFYSQSTLQPFNVEICFLKFWEEGEAGIIQIFGLLLFTKEGKRAKFKLLNKVKGPIIYVYRFEKVTKYKYVRRL